MQESHSTHFVQLLRFRRADSKLFPEYLQKTLSFSWGGRGAKTVNPALLYVFQEVKLGRWQLSWGEQLGVAVAPLGGAVSPAPPAQGSSL